MKSQDSSQNKGKEEEEKGEKEKFVFMRPVPNADKKEIEKWFDLCNTAIEKQCSQGKGSKEHAIYECDCTCNVSSDARLLRAMQANAKHLKVDPSAHTFLRSAVQKCVSTCDFITLTTRVNSKMQEFNEMKGKMFELVQREMAMKEQEDKEKGS